MTWMSENAINVDELDDETDIDAGAPRWLEEVAGPMFFPRLWRGVVLRDGRRVTIERNNVENRYAIDFAVKLDGMAVAAIDVERKKSGSSYLFESDLPINVPLYTLRAHRSGDYRGFDGGPAYSGKIRMFRRYPSQTFFMAVRHDATRALLVRGLDVVDETRWEWISANGGYHQDHIYVSRVPRAMAVDCQPGSHEAEEFVLGIVGPMLVAA